MAHALIHFTTQIIADFENLREFVSVTFHNPFKAFDPWIRAF